LLLGVINISLLRSLKLFENLPFVFEEYYPSGVLHWKGNYLNGENEHDTLKVKAI